MEMKNSYEDSLRAAAYAKLEFTGTYFLAYRDLPSLILEHVRGDRAIDFGCGTGRSSRFLKKLGFRVVGVDIAEDMVENARLLDPEGDYRRIADGNLSGLPRAGWDLVLSVFTFDNIPTREKKIAITADIATLLRPEGRFINLVSAPEIYVNEWASFSTRDFPDNWKARSGDRVKIVITDIADARPVEDVVCSDEEYRSIYARAGLEVLTAHRPLGKADEPFQWVNETEISPWVIYVLSRSAGDSSGPESAARGST